MYLSRIYVKNFRNFHFLDVKLSPKSVVVGENNVGKTNLLFALRLILDPRLPDHSRQLRQEDFWDGLSEPAKKWRNNRDCSRNNWLPGRRNGIGSSARLLCLGTSTRHSPLDVQFQA